MDRNCDREGRERRGAVGHGAKQTECGIPADVHINKLAQCLTATSPPDFYLEETSDKKLSFRNRQQLLIPTASYAASLTHSTSLIQTHRLQFVCMS